MKRVTLLVFSSILFVLSAQAQSLGEVFAPLNKVDKGNYMSRQREYLTKVASHTGYQRGQNARYLSRTAATVKDLYTEAYDNALAYEANMKKSQDYGEISSKISSLKYYLKQGIRYSNTIKIYAARIANNYKSGSNRDYFYEIQNAYNSLVKVKKKAKDSVFSILSWQSLKDTQNDHKKRMEDAEKRQIMLEKMKKK
ncbi:MAG: hypothetical protein JXR71_06790 [Bacteroidales bacterium]|nr:hypothetical protein [Bacteroidales bacterium]